MISNTGSELVYSKHGLLTTIAWQIGDEVTYALEGSVFIAGALIQWLRDGLQLFEDAAETQAMAESVSDSGGVFVVPAFVGLGAPHWDPYARGTIVGLPVIQTVIILSEPHWKQLLTSLQKFSAVLPTIPEQKSKNFGLTEAPRPMIFFVSSRQIY